MTEQTETETEDYSHNTMGFWGCWSLTVGIMIGSGIFMLPAVLAPYGMLGFGGWIITAGGSILLALVLGRLSTRTERTGGPYTFAHDAFGDLTGFLVAWGYWAAIWIGVPAIAIAFVGYLTIFLPILSDQPMMQAGAALVLIWALTFVSLKGTREMSIVQLLMTLLKLVPLFVIIGLGLVAGDVDNLPEYNPSDGSFLSVFSTTALLTMWAFLGLECGTIPAGEVKNPKTTIPTAVIGGTIAVALIYICATAAVMMLVPADVLAQSTSPFADAARGLGQWGPTMIASGALIATAGSINGNIFISGQMPMAVALDKLAPKILAARNADGAPYFSLILGSALSSLLLILNYSRGLVDAFTFLLMMSTLAALIPLLVSALAELKHSLKAARAWAVVALIASLYSLFAIYGSGVEVLRWGVVLMIAGLPVYVFGKQRR
jgi:APA family basic amino acid/polyamine antiporter